MFFPKRWYLPTSPHGVTTQKTNNDIFTAVRPRIAYNKNLIYFCKCYIGDSVRHKRNNTLSSKEMKPYNFLNEWRTGFVDDTNEILYWGRVWSECCQATLTLVHVGPCSSI
jgi:hypothetical protein